MNNFILVPVFLIISQWSQSHTCITESVGDTPVVSITSKIYYTTNVRIFCNKFGIRNDSMSNQINQIFGIVCLERALGFIFWYIRIKLIYNWFIRKRGYQVPCLLLAAIFDFAIVTVVVASHLRNIGKRNIQNFLPHQKRKQLERHVCLCFINDLWKHNRTG